MEFHSIVEGCRVSALVSGVHGIVLVLSVPHRGFAGASFLRLMTLEGDQRPDLVWRRGPWLGSSRERHEMLGATSEPIVISS